MASDCRAMKVIFGRVAGSPSLVAREENAPYIKGKQYLHLSLDSFLEAAWTYAHPRHNGNSG